MKNNVTPSWIAVDWGTSRFRAWAIDATGAVLDAHTSSDGAQMLEPADFEPAFLGQVSHWLTPGAPILVVCCGMVGSRQGWIDAGYRVSPCATTNSAQLVRAQSTNPSISVYVVPGIKQMTPPDVMRGEETQISGYLMRNPDFDGVLCLPGTHTKWVRARAGKIVNFKTFLTGEMFALLSEKSILRHFIGASGWNPDAFLSAFAAAFGDPALLVGELFGLRAGSLVTGFGPAEARSRLSGLLIGAEIAAARGFWDSDSIAVIGSEVLVDIYSTALKSLGLHPHAENAEALTLAGLNSVYRRLIEVEPVS